MQHGMVPGYPAGYAPAAQGAVQITNAPQQYLQNLPAAYATRPEAFVPPNMSQRVGPSELIHQEIFDHPITGLGQLLIDDEPIFSNPARIGLPQFTNLKKAGELSNNKQFEIAAIYSFFQADQPAGTNPPANAPSVSRLFYLLNSYTRVELKIQDASKMIIQGHRLSAGGGVWGFDNNANALVKNFGTPDADNVFVLGEGFVVPPLKTFSLNLKWMSQLPNAGGVAFSPLDQFNFNTTCEKLLRYGLIGWEARDMING